MTKGKQNLEKSLFTKDCYFTGLELCFCDVLPRTFLNITSLNSGQELENLTAGDARHWSSQEQSTRKFNREILGSVIVTESEHRVCPSPHVMTNYVYMGYFQRTEWKSRQNLEVELLLKKRTAPSEMWDFCTSDQVYFSICTQFRKQKAETLQV